MLDHLLLGGREDRHLVNASDAALLTRVRSDADRPTRRTWSEQTLPFGLTSFLLVTPGDWTLTENSCDVHLPLAPTPSASEGGVTRWHRTSHS